MMKHSDWLFQVTLPNLTNQSTLFQHSFATLKLVYDNTPFCRELQIRKLQIRKGL